jgi:hypothetical protein
VKYAKYGTMVLMLAIFVGFSTTPAAAQQAFKGSFDLPGETYWGSTLFLLSGPPTPDRVSNRNTLRLENINGAYVVRHLDAGILGQSYVFPVAKNVRMQVQRASTSAQVVVPVSTGGSE